MKYKIIFLIIGIALFTNAQVLDLKNIHNYQAYDKGVKINGNCFMPKWSNNSQRIAVDFSGENLLSVGLADIENERLSLLNIKSGSTQSMPGLGGQREKKENTWNMVFSKNSTDMIYAISTRDHYRHLYEIGISSSNGNYKIEKYYNISKRITQLAKEHIFNPVYFSALTVKRFGTPEKRNSILFSYSKEDNENNIGRFKINSTTNQIYFSNLSKIKGHSELVVNPIITPEGQKQYIVIEQLLNQNSIFYTKNFTEMEKISDVENKIYKNVQWNKDGSFITYLMSEETTIENETGDVSLLYSLWSYDINSKIRKRLYYPVFVDNKKDRQASVALTPDDRYAIVINAEPEKKQNLIVINLLNGENYEIESSYMHHFDIAISPNGQWLAFTAKGSHDSEELNYYKLYTAEIHYK